MSKVGSKLEKISKATKSYRIYYYICHTQNNTCTDYHFHVKTTCYPFRNQKLLIFTQKLV